MTFLEVLKSGRPFRRKNDEYWFSAAETDGSVHMNIKDILADDWEILEPAVTITRTQFWEAVGPFGDSVPSTYIGGRRFVPLDYWPNLAEIARKLGLEDR